MTRADADVLIAGGGLAAQRAAETLRRLGFDGRVVMLCGEGVPPYDRPPLSKDLLTGGCDARSLRLRPDQWYLDNEVRLMLGAQACGLDVQSKRVQLADGSALRYECLVVATGSRPRQLAPLPVRGAVHELRSVKDATALRAALSGAERVAVVGAGLIGMEVASSVTRLGLQATLIEAAPIPLGRVLPPPLGRWLVRLHRRAGVDVRLGTEVLSATPRRRANGFDLKLSDGQRVEAALVLVAAGVVPATQWLSESPLGHGAVNVDQGGRTIVPDVYAAGDAACFPGPGAAGAVPTQHWEAAARQGVAVAHAITRRSPPAPMPEMFWSDQHGARIQVVGHLDGADQLRLEGDPDSHQFTAWLCAGERPLGAMLVNQPRRLPEARRRIAVADRGDLQRKAA